MNRQLNLYITSPNVGPPECMEVNPTGGRIRESKVSATAPDAKAPVHHLSAACGAEHTDE
ncbi:hypothetical protein GCM10009682_05910 [Luedemannella flava]|uniref:Uncharacterized protein n=1 Tax=Luedemannella flava TaxID=349316 RepID=A0ABP4XPB8_9ACTN